MSEIMKKDAQKELPRFRPATDILEREDGFHIFMDLPGVQRENMVIDLQENELVVTGRAGLDHNQSERFVEMQFGECEYARSISIADIIDRERIKANLENGVLELYLPKVDKALPKRIPISVA